MIVRHRQGGDGITNHSTPITEVIDVSNFEISV